MTPSLRRSFVVAGSMGAALAGGALVLLIFLPRSWDHLAAMGSTLGLPPDQLRLYAAQVASDLTFDSGYLLGHAIMWLGYAALVAKDSKGAATSIAALGLLGTLLDFTENEMRWAAVRLALVGSSAPSERLADWQMVFGLSYWPLFLCSIVTGIAVSGRSGGGWAIAALAAACAFAGPSVYKAGPLPAFLWIIVWHLASSVFLWSQAQKADILPRAA